MGSTRLLDAVPAELLVRFRRGIVIPAMPLALSARRHLDERHQAALIRYYIDAGAGGLAVGVHTTQFAIRDQRIGLFETLLRFASGVADTWCEREGLSILKIAGICGRTRQALHEAVLARDAGYHAGLISLGAFSATEPVPTLIAHCAAIAEVMPIIGFYLQPAVGGRILPYRFWRELAEDRRLIGVKIAPFSRYQTLDVIRAVCDSGRADEVALYTGNDDAIVADLVTEYAIETPRGPQRVRIVGGLLGQWAVWTRRAVELLGEAHRLRLGDQSVPQPLLTLGARITDANAAIFDAAHGYAGCIPGIHEVLYRQGLFASTACLNPAEVLSPGQAAEIDRVYGAYPELNDDAFVSANLGRWLG
ncbi:MAG: dihydrodipicolinate synthase family protein [Anaerolineae bacterium]|jgi:dihydrodipicolinate synthase/N-acetylneuraminate lyase|nr:dihydrodipicolinate synthase family protein [Anaerolineae bacterium]